MNIVWLNATIDPARIYDFFNHPSFCSHLFKMSTNPGMVKKGQWFNSAFCILH